MSRLVYLASLILFASQQFLHINATEMPKHFMLIPEEQRDQPYIIPFDHAKQCQTIANMFEDASEGISTPIPRWPIENGSGRDTLNFVYYLQNIYNINQLPKQQDVDMEEPFRKQIATQMRRLDSQQLTNLFTTVNILNVIDRNNNHLISDEVARRIIENPAQAKSFYALNGQPLFRDVVKKISTAINFEQKYIQPYVNTLTQRQELERTVSMLTAAWYNVTNALTAPVQWFISPPYPTKTIMRPYYLDSKTGTMITGFVQEHDPKDKVTELLITNKKKNQNQTISLGGNNIAIIKQIEANATETAFICRTTNNKAIIINTLNKENPVIDHDFVDCVFLNDGDCIYAIKNQELGLLNINDGTFKVSQKLEHKSYTGIAINKNKKTLAICCNNREIWIIDQKDPDAKKVFSANRIYNMCLHPTENILYVHYSKQQKTEIIAVNINDGSCKLLNDTISKGKGNIFQFLPNSDDILFIGTSAKVDYENSHLRHEKWFELRERDDYFINIKNGHIWSKKKNIRNQRIFGTKETKTNDDYERIALTSDGMKSIEQAIEGNVLIDFLLLCLSKNNNDQADFSIKKIIAAPLVDQTTIETIRSLNGGFLSPQIITAILHDSNTEKTNGRSDQEPQKLMSAIRNQWKYEWIKNFFYFAAAIIAIPLKIKMDSWEREQKYKPIHQTKKLTTTYYGIDVGKTVSSLAAGALFLFFLDRVFA